MDSRSHPVKDYEGWGRCPRARSHPIWVSEPSFVLPLAPQGVTSYLLPYGMGRSYGDSCLNDGYSVLETRGLNRFLAFDENSGVLKLECGVTLEDVIQVFGPKGWFPAVVPGTKFVTIGGAIANDVHGKNHSHAGTFGCHVVRFEILRSDGRFVCSPEENKDLFQATIGGLGLTGLITWAEIRLRKIPSDFVRIQKIRFESIDDYFTLASENATIFEHCVAWLDCMASPPQQGRGLFSCANWSSIEATTVEKQRRQKTDPFCIPLGNRFEAPSWLMSPNLMKQFNRLYFHKQRQKIVNQVSHFDSFFFPLDGITNWNRVYGRNGFLQYQCVIPGQMEAAEPIREILRRMERAGIGAALAVLKQFGPRRSPGLLSFPREGVSLALDFPNLGESLFSLLSELGSITASAGGRVYPAKDTSMSPALFSQFYPNYSQFEKHRDHAFSSSFIRRVA